MLTFCSSVLSRDVKFDEVAKLSDSQLEAFHVELKAIAQSLSNSLNEIKDEEKLTGIPHDADWMHRIVTKKRIALKFAAEVHARLQGGSTAEQREAYQRIYAHTFRGMLVEEFGEEELQGMEREAALHAIKEYTDWIDSTDQRMWFTPRLPGSKSDTKSEVERTPAPLKSTKVYNLVNASK